MHRTLKEYSHWQITPTDSISTLPLSLRRLVKHTLITLQPHIAIRYEPVISYLESQDYNPGKDSLLEVGSGSLGITRFWHTPITGVDISFEGPKLGFLQEVEGTVKKLPFEADSFSYVISIDMLEHIPEKDRELACQEMLRVATKGVIIGVPCGIASWRAERNAMRRHDMRISRISNLQKRAELNRRAAFLSEHTLYGFPNEQTIALNLESAARNLEKPLGLTIIGNESIAVWNFLLPSVIPYNWLDCVSRKCIAAITFPILKHISFGDYYRSIFIASLWQQREKSLR